MAKKYTDKKIGLGEPLASMLQDFCAANYNAPAIEVIRAAINEHIENRLKNQEIKERYERARRERLGQADKVVRLVEKE